jgi:predicted metal-dependent peptidase
MSAIQTCALTPQQEKQWSDTRVAFQWHQPAFAHVFYSLLTNDNKHYAVFTKDAEVCPIAATDGSRVIINPDTFFQFSINARVLILAHEILHCIWNHCGLMHQFHQSGKIGYPDGKTLPYDQELMNVATDLVINDLLIESKVGEAPTRDGKKIILHDTKLATGKDSALDAYRKVYKEKQGGGGGCWGGLSFDKHLKPGAAKGKDPGAAAQERNESQWQTTVAAAMQSAKLQGKLPAAMERAFAELLEPKVDWRERIQSWFARKVGSGTYNWNRPDRRLIAREVDAIIAPGRSGFGAECVVVGCDTSGSINYGKFPDGRPSEGDMFLAEMAGILEEVRPKRLIIIWCDAKVHRLDEADEPGDLHTIRAKGAPGGGGTSFVPVFDKIAELGLTPDALVYLTDGLGTFPKEAPNYPVIWGNIYPDAKFPFGDVVDIPKQVA